MYDQLMQFVFDWCVGFLVWWANAGITYEELNVWLFVIVHPIVKGPSVADPRRRRFAW